MARGLFAVLESELETEVIPAADENLERVEELEAQVAQSLALNIFTTCPDLI
jgi:hypothetical protein